jgi:hypothetical protein
MTLWTRDRDGAWQPVTIATPLAIGVAGEVGSAVTAAVARLVPFVDRGRPAAALVPLGGAPVLVNGIPPLGLAVLADRDEIVVGDARFAFTPYGPPVAEAWPADAPPTRCARCGASLKTGDVCIRCPSCSAPAHEEKARNCFSYDPLTACCRRARAALHAMPDEEDAHAGT